MAHIITISDIPAKREAVILQCFVMTAINMAKSQRPTKTQMISTRIIIIPFDAMSPRHSVENELNLKSMDAAALGRIGKGLRKPMREDSEWLQSQPIDARVSRNKTSAGDDLPQKSAGNAKDKIGKTGDERNEGSLQTPDQGIQGLSLCDPCLLLRRDSFPDWGSVAERRWWRRDFRDALGC